MKKKFKSSNVEVEWTFDLSEKLRKNFSNKDLKDETEKVAIVMIKDLIDKGISPVNGVRAFEKYKDPKKYPAGLKPSNKPNLKLTGEMLSFYGAKEGTNQMTVKVGMHNMNEKVKQKFEANNSGTQGAKGLRAIQDKTAKTRGHLAAVRRKAASKVIQSTKGIPPRPIVPKNGQSFNRSIVLAVNKIFAKIMSLAIKK